MLAEPIVALFRTWRGRLIAAVLAVQVLLPLRYYACNRDPRDERFAWRMFSPTRMERCAVSFVQAGRAPQLGREFHEAWLEVAQRGRLAVIEAMGAELCRRHGGPVTATVDCRDLDDRHERFASGRDGRLHADDDDDRDERRAPPDDLCGEP